jgi:hypothetical protein
MSAFSRALPIFTIVYSALYALSFAYDLQLFMYYPAIGEFSWTAQPETSGPPINWYGWMATAAIGGLAAAVAGTMLPERWNRALAALSWVVPAAAMAVLTYLARNWFL